MNLRTILNRKGHVVYTVSSRAKLSDAVQLMVKHNCGSLIICDDETLVGIVSERDILRAMAEGQRSLAEITVGERMRRDVVTCEPTDDVNKVMGLMSEHHVRHMPVVENGRVAGLISIGDVVKAQHEQLAVENHFLMSYIQS